MVNALLPRKDFIRIRTTHNERFLGNKIPWQWLSVFIENILTRAGRFDHVICISKKIEQQIHYQRKSIIYNALTTYTTNRLKKQSKRKPDVRIIGRISAQKAQYAFIDHCRKSFDSLRNLPFNLTLIGKEDDTSLSRKIEQESCGHVRFKGLCSNQIDMYREADWVIIPSQYEGLSSVMVEAVCNGIPVISMPVSGAEDVLSLNGLGYFVTNYDEMIEVILGTKPWTIPIEKRIALSEQFSIEKASLSHAQLYDSFFCK
ncbi:hypothetical protein TH19_20295 [Thalassospira profundimaris]|uniref:Glycosyl transferase family 1 domain-containing protein n=2 Tax=Thalassospira TaxID=168934 RepID=A0A367VZD2_9PROT|nr:hypothetical protein TH19_20295 [Thalassospira profundimaris]